MARPTVPRLPKFNDGSSDAREYAPSRSVRRLIGYAKLAHRPPDYPARLRVVTGDQQVEGVGNGRHRGDLELGPRLGSILDDARQNRAAAAIDDPRLNVGVSAGGYSSFKQQAQKSPGELGRVGPAGSTMGRFGKP